MVKKLQHNQATHPQLIKVMEHQTLPSSPLGHMEVVTSPPNLVLLQATNQVDIQEDQPVLAVVVVVVVVGINSPTKAQVTRPAINPRVAAMVVAMEVVLPVEAAEVVVVVVVVIQVTEVMEALEAIVLNPDTLVEVAVIVVVVMEVADTKGMYCFCLCIFDKGSEGRVS